MDLKWETREDERERLQADTAQREAADAIELSSGDEEETGRHVTSIQNDEALARRLQEEEDALGLPLQGALGSMGGPKVLKQARLFQAASPRAKESGPPAQTPAVVEPQKPPFDPSTSIYLHDLDNCIDVALTAVAAGGEPLFSDACRAQLERLRAASDTERLVVARLLRLTNVWNHCSGKQPRLTSYVPERTADQLMATLAALEARGLVLCHEFAAGAPRDR